MEVVQFERRLSVVEWWHWQKLEDNYFHGKTLFQSMTTLRELFFEGQLMMFVRRTAKIT